MTSRFDPVTEGWKDLINSTKWHYFVDGRSLCRRWMTMSSMGLMKHKGLLQANDCKACYKALIKRLPKDTEHEAS